MARADPRPLCSEMTILSPQRGTVVRLDQPLSGNALQESELIHLSSVVRVSGGCGWRVQRPWELE